MARRCAEPSHSRPRRFRGQKAEVSFGTAYAFTEKGEFGQVYNYKFSTGEIKSPLQ